MEFYEFSDTAPKEFTERIKKFQDRYELSKNIAIYLPMALGFVTAIIGLLANLSRFENDTDGFTITLGVLGALTTLANGVTGQVVKNSKENLDQYEKFGEKRGYFRPEQQAQPRISDRSLLTQNYSSMDTPDHPLINKTESEESLPEETWRFIL